MKFIKRLVVAVLLLVFVITVSDLQAISNPVTAQAATIKISKKTLSMEVNQTVTLKVTGAKKTIKWSSSDKKVATVSAKGKVKAIAAGDATITAAVQGKKLKCKVTVEESNPLIKDAPFDAKEVTIGKVHVIMPNDWKSPSASNTAGELSKGMVVDLTPKDTSLNSEMVFTIAQLSKENLLYYSNYDSFKAFLSGYVTQDILKTSLLTKFSTVEITSFEQTDFVTSYGKVFRTDMVATLDNVPTTVVIYDLVVGNYLIDLTTADSDNLNLEKITDYMVNTLKVK